MFFIPHILQIEFFPYTDHGDLWWKDGEYFARKVNLLKLHRGRVTSNHHRVWDEFALSLIPMLPSTYL